MLKLPSGSKIGLAFKCLGSVLLPQVKDEAGKAADDGKELHAYIERYIKEGRSLANIPERHHSLCDRISLSIGSVEHESAEVGIVVDPVGRVSYFVSADGIIESSSGVLRSGSVGILEHGGPVLAPSGSDDLGREHGSVSTDDGISIDRSSQFVAVADYVARRSASEYSVFDWKSGSWATDPEHNWQLLLPAIAIWLSLGEPDDFWCDLSIGYIGQPDDSSWHDGDGGIRSKHFRVSSADLRRRLSELYSLRLRLVSDGEARGSVALYEGKHCQYCPARHRCPAKVGAIADAIDGLGRNTDDRWIVKTAMTLMDSKPQIDKAAKNILKEHGGELDLGDGRVAVLTKDAKGREKVYTRHAKKEDTARSNASEDDQSSAEGGGSSPAE